MCIVYGLGGMLLLILAGDIGTISKSTSIQSDTI